MRWQSILLYSQNIIPLFGNMCIIYKRLSSFLETIFLYSGSVVVFLLWLVHGPGLAEFYICISIVSNNVEVQFDMSMAESNLNPEPFNPPDLWQFLSRPDLLAATVSVGYLSSEICKMRLERNGKELVMLLNDCETALWIYRDILKLR